MSSSEAERHLTLAVPGLAGLAADGGEEAPTLERLLSRGERLDTGVDDTSHDGLLFAAFGISAQDADWPVAAVTRALDTGVAESGWHLRADPVHLSPDMASAVLLDGESFPLSADEAADLTGEINRHLTGEGWQVEALHPTRWYVRLDAPARLRTSPLDQVAGRDLRGHLPRGEEAGAWQQRMNDIQMLLHASPVNAAREARGEVPVNSVWFWGGGKLPLAGAAPWQHVWADCALARGLAVLAGVPTSPVPAGGDAWLKRARAPGGHLVVFGALHDAARSRDADAWLLGMRSLERDWALPLARALKQGSLASLTVLTGGPHSFRVRRRLLGRWWRRRRPLGELVGA